MTVPSLLRKPFRYTFWNASLVIIGINLLVYLLTMADPVMSKILSMNPLFVVQNQMYWQVFTYQFVHGGLSHLVFNMLGVLFFGQAVERRLGSKEFLLLYLLSGTLCGVFSLLLYIITGTWYVFLMGASGAVFALLLAYAVLYPSSIVLIWGIIPVPAPILVLGYAALEVLYMLTGTNQGVAHSTHLIGFAVAWVYFVIRFGIDPIRVWTRK
jgi:membrane associated rhomboid family serine protease